MAIDVPSFLKLYPEFLDAPADLVAAKLAEAQQLVPPEAAISIWGAGGDPTRDLAQQAVFLYCADFLVTSPYARKMALAQTDKKATDSRSPYRVRLDNLKRIVGMGYRVI